MSRAVETLLLLLIVLLVGCAAPDVKYDDLRPATTETLAGDTFLIEGGGLILAPFFPVSRYRFDSKERVGVETPEGRVFEAEADFKIPLVTPKPEVLQLVCVLRSLQQSDLPIGSRVVQGGEL